jgi:hypothetical protein
VEGRVELADRSLMQAATIAYGEAPMTRDVEFLVGVFIGAAGRH